MEESGLGHVVEIRGVKGRLKATAAPALPSFISPIIPSPAACPPQYTTYVPPPPACPPIRAHELHIRSTNTYSPQARRLRANRTRAPWLLASTTRSKPSARSLTAFRGKCTRFGRSEMSLSQRVSLLHDSRRNWGISRSREVAGKSRLVDTRRALPAYSSPEQTRKGAISRKSPLSFSLANFWWRKMLGEVLHKGMTTHHHPFRRTFRGGEKVTNNITPPVMRTLRAILHLVLDPSKLR